MKKINAFIVVDFEGKVMIWSFRSEHTKIHESGNSSNPIFNHSFDDLFDIVKGKAVYELIPIESEIVAYNIIMNLPKSDEGLNIKF